MAEKGDSTITKAASQFREVIRQNYTFLIKELCADELLDELFEKHVFEIDDNQRVRSEPTDQARNRKLLDILLHKPEQQAIVILETIHKTNEHIWRCLVECKLKEYPTTLSTTLLEPDTRLSLLRSCVSDKIQYKPNSTLCLKEVTDRLGKVMSEAGIRNVSDDEIISTIQFILPLSRLDRWEVARKPRKKKNTGQSKFEGIAWKKSTTGKLSMSTETPGHDDEDHDDHDDEMDPKELMNAERTDIHCAIQSWSTDDVCAFLGKLDIDLEIADSFREQAVTGDVFELMTREEMKEISSGKFGHLKRIIAARDELLRGDAKSVDPAKFVEQTRKVKETVRKFDTEVSVTCKYRKGYFLPEVNPHISDPLEPIGMYRPLDDDSNESIVRFQKQVMQFLCACMNDRVNGTIYFGVKTDGEIVGVPGKISKWNSALADGIETYFYPDEREQASKCMRPLRPVEVLSQATSPMYVLEVDVVPAYDLCQENAFYIKKSTINGSKIKFGKQELVRYDRGKIKSVEGDQMLKFMNIKQSLATHRHEKEQERLTRHLQPPNLGSKLKRLLCRGEETLEGDIFPILVTNALSGEWTETQKKQNLHFLKDLPWKAVFDFDNGNGLYQYLDEEEEQVLKVLTVDDFDQNYSENQRNSDRLPKLIEDLKNSSHRPWIFANGSEQLDQSPLPVVKWKQKRSEGFKEAVRFMKNEIPKGRAVVVFMLFCKEYEVMIEAADELIQKFGNQWFTIAESDEVAEKWEEGLVKKHLVESKAELDDKSVVGIPWNHVNDTVIGILGTTREISCELITSTGSFVKLSDRLKNDWVDLEIVSARECKVLENEEIVDSANIEAQFYKGGEVDWWNFHFGHHVLERHCFKSLKDCVFDTLSGNNSEEDRVACVYLYHQPGAGGTTTAKQVLWHLKDQYRCAVVKKITNQTSDQITQFHIYEDREPKPVLLLFDNLDEERTSEIRAQLEEKAKQISRHDFQNPCPVFYVFLHCKRNTSVPLDKAGSKFFVLRHELQLNEQLWFRDKYDELKKKFDENEKSGVNPKHLISFNIMKENFDTTYIEKTVYDLINEIKDKNERELLKYVSLLNAYDISFQSLPASAFDGIMETEEQYASFIMSNRWELHLSQPLTILLNHVKKKNTGEGHHIRIIHNTLSKNILKKYMLVGEECGNLLLSDMAMEFLESKLFSSMYPDNSVDQLLKVVRDVVKKRAHNPQDGKPETKFAPLIEEIVKNPKEGTECAAQVLEKVYKLSDDVFVGQQLARVYIDSKNWEEAVRFAKEITDKKPGNSYLWDTFGHSYKEQVKEKYKDCIEKTITPNEAKEILDLAFAAIHIFQKEQQVSECEGTTYANNAGYFQELATVTTLFDCLSLVDELQEDDTLHKVLVKAVPLPPILQTAFGERREMCLHQIQDGVNKAMVRLEDEHLQLRDDMADEYRKSSLRRGKDMLIRVKENLENYYGEETNEVPGNLSEEEACKYRRRRIFRLASGNTFRAVFELRRKDGGEEKLCDIRKLVHDNMKSKYRDMFDLQTILSVNLSLCCVNAHYKWEITREDMAIMSKELYEHRDKCTEHSLEPFLFAAMFNWPFQNSKQRFPIPAQEIPEILRNWKQAYFNKYPRQREEGRPYKKKETTMFFLGNGEGMDGFAFDRDLRLGSGLKRKNEYFWRSSQVLEKLDRWTGCLLHDGNEVRLSIIQCGNKLNINIPTSFPILNRGWWNKKVYLVIGFTWAGPKAFDVNIEDPRKRSLGHTAPTSKTGRRQQSSTAAPRPRENFVQYNNNVQFLNELRILQHQLMVIEDIKTKKPQYHKRTHEERELCNKERGLRHKYQTIIGYRKQAVDEFYTSFEHVVF